VLGAALCAIWRGPLSNLVARLVACKNQAMTTVISSSLAEVLSNPDRLIEAVRAGKALRISDLDVVIASPETLIELADQLAEEELESEMVSYRRNVTGVDHTIFISTKGRTRHSARVKVAIDPPDSINPQSVTASVAIDDGQVVAGTVPAAVLQQVQRFIEANRLALLDYWEFRIDTDQLRKRLTVP